MATISNTPRPGYIWDATDNVWYPIGVGAHQHTNAADTPAVMPYSTYVAAGKNKIINGDFAINQRAFSSTTTSDTYGFDRIKCLMNDGTVTYSAQTFTPGTAPVSGYEAKNFGRILTTSQTSSSAYGIFLSNVEDVRTLAGQTATVSFWAKAASGTPKVAVEVQQNFGAGGSPSADVQTYGGQVTLSTAWTRYSMTVSIPSISGKTIGTTNPGRLDIYLWVSAGSAFNSRSGTLGIQSNTFDFWGLQLEAGSNATAFQTATGNPASELAACQRYYYRNLVGSTNFGFFGWGIGQSSTASLWAIQNPVTMRTTPTVVEFANLGFAQVGSITAITTLVHSNSSPSTSFLQSDGSATANTIYRLMANNSSGAYLGIGAEL